ncbi:MAG: hypothetical protein LBU37_08695 [Tannerellaceae bacterium]|jgi:hypothetical protein|nr:hypothetical protein [Tannerellaceae bacterium]
MAIIRNNAFFDASGSIGDITFRNVNGRIIVSRKITHTNSNTPKQRACRNSFGQMSKLAKSLKLIINAGFDPIENGSKYNHFYKANAALADFISRNNIKDCDNLPVCMLYNVLADEAFTGQVLSARGNMDARSEFVIDAEGQVSGLLSLSRAFKAGDSITAGIALLVDVHRRLMETVVLQTYALAPPDIEGLTSPNQFLINKKNWEALNACALSPLQGAIRGVVITAIVDGPPDRAGRPNRSTAYFSLPATGQKK